MGYELMCKQHGLGMLHMGAARHHRMAGVLGLHNKRIGKVEQLVCDHAGMTAHPHADERGDLVVARATGTKLAAQFVTGNLQQAALQCGGFVLVVVNRREFTGIHLTLQFIQCGFHALQLICGEQACTPQSAGMGTGTGYVIVSETPIELSRLAQQCELGRGAGRESPSPQSQVILGFGLVIVAHISPFAKTAMPSVLAWNTKEEAFSRLFPA